MKIFVLKKNMLTCGKTNRCLILKSYQYVQILKCSTNIAIRKRNNHKVRKNSI